MTQHRQYQTQATYPSPELVNEFMKIGNNIELCLLACQAQGIVSEMKLTPGWSARYQSLTKADQARLSDLSDADDETFALAIQVAGGVVSEMTKLQIQQMGNRQKKQSVRPKMVNGRPEIIDTPDTRAEAIRSLGINI